MRIANVFRLPDGKMNINRWPRLREKLQERYGEDYVEIMLEEDYDEAEYAQMLREYDVLLTMWGSPWVPEELADNPGKLRYICNITGEMRSWISEKIVSSPHFTVTNWGDATAHPVAEGAFLLMLAMLKNIPIFIDSLRENKTFPPDFSRNGSLYKRRLCIYGLGAIGRKFLDFVRPFEPDVYVYDPYLKDVPEDVTMVDTLEELFDKAQIMVVHAGLCEETRGSVTADLLARLEDNAIFINTARGAIVDQEALEAELISGRIRAGLDVMGPPDVPAEDSPLRKLTNVLITGHRVMYGDWGWDESLLTFPEEICFRNILHFEHGEPLEFVMTPERYKIST